MFFKSVFLLLFLGTTVQSSISKHKEQNATPKSAADTFQLVNPKQVHQLEKTIYRFLSNIAGPIEGPIILKSNKESDLAQTVRKMCESMRLKLIQFAEDCGLKTTIRRNFQASSDFPLSEGWFSEILLQGSYLLRDLGSIIDQTKESIDRYFGKRNSIRKGNEKLPKHSKKFEFLGVVYDAAVFGEGLSECLLQTSTRNYKKSFDLNRSLLNLTKLPTRNALQIFRGNLNNASKEIWSKNRGKYVSWHGLLCFSMMNSENIRYSDCMKDLGRMDNCLTTLKQRLESKTEEKSWTRAIERLSNCETQTDKGGKLLVSCDTDRRIPRKIRMRIKYMFEKILGRKILRESSFHKAADDLATVLSRSDWGRKLVDELSQYFAIYEGGRQRLRGFLKRKDERGRHEVSRALKQYKKGIFLKTFHTITRIHKSAMSFEKYLVEGIKTILNEAWEGHVKLLSSLINWLTKLFDLYAVESGKETEEYSSKSLLEPEETISQEISTSNSDNSVQSLSRTDIKKNVDKAMAHLMKSMNHVASHRTSNEKSMLSCLANNLLLITIFVETISLVSALFCSTQSSKEAEKSLETEDSWRKRRSLLPFEFEDDFSINSPEHLLLGIEANFTRLIDTF